METQLLPQNVIDFSDLRIFDLHPVLHYLWSPRTCLSVYGN
jgi:hypothetical protein